MARDRARKADQRANAAEAGVPYSNAPARRRPADPPQPCWHGCRSQYLAWNNAAGAVDWCAEGDHPVCVDCQRRPVAEQFALCDTCGSAHERADRARREQEKRRDLLTRCRGVCLSVEQSIVQTHPGRSTTELADSASFTCAHCDNLVCLNCGKVPVTGALQFCDPCGDRLTAHMDPQPFADEPSWGNESRAKLLDELKEVVADLRRVSGLPFDVLNGRLNRAMAVRRRADAGPEQLTAGIGAGRQWLATITARVRTR